MNGKRLARQTGLYLQRHSAAILTIVGSIGVIATAVTAAKATPRAIQLLNEAEVEKREELTRMEIIRTVAPVYIPSFLIGCATIGCIFSIHILDYRRQSTLTSAYMLLDQSFKDYKAKVKELYGDDADKQIQAGLLRDHLKETVDISLSSDEQRLFYEEYYGQIFERTMLEVQDAEYQLNRKFVLDGEANLNDFFEFLGLPKSKAGEALGWSLEAGCAFYGYSWIDFEHELVTLDDGMECYIINMPKEPTIGYSIPF